MSTIATRFNSLQERVQNAVQRAGRSPEAITIVAISKTFSPEVIVEAYEAGLRHFGENRNDEFVEKQAAVRDIVGPETGIVWHFVGTLQSRQTHDIADHADRFHALDRLKIANRLSRRLQENGRPPLPTFVEVNVSGEGSKAGFDASRWEDDGRQREALAKAAEVIAALPCLEIRGLMTMAPWQAPESVIRRTFARTRELAAWLATVVPQADWSQLSMGMTNDFELAIEEGATHIRVGRALFGERET